MSIVEIIRAEQAANRTDDRRWQQQMESLAETRHQESRRDQERRNNQTMAVAIIAASAAIASAIVATAAFLAK